MTRKPRATLTTDELKFCLITAGVLGDATRAAQSYDYGGLKFIVRAATDCPIADAGWLTFGVLDALARNLTGRTK